MKRFETLDSFTTPDGEPMVLARRDGEHYILLGGEELMSTRAADSEMRLAELGCRGLAGTARPRVLIGGLGLGFTLRAALAALPAAGEAVVAEIFPRVVEWNRRHLGEPWRRALADRRTRVVERDVWEPLGEPAAFDAVLLDVDNGPGSWVLGTNRRLYGPAGLRRIRRALRPGGALIVWSTHPERGFLERLRTAGFEAGQETVRAHRGKGPRHTLFMARAAAGG